MHTLDVLQDGKQHVISQAEYEHFLDALPPVCMEIQYQGQRWDFGFAEGADHVYLFRRDGDRFLAVKTPYLNPYEAGAFQIQARRWILKWIELAKHDPSFRAAGSPRIDTQTFQEYADDDELIEDLRLGGWRPGQALFIGKLCFVKLGEDDDEWLAIRDDKVQGRMSFLTLLDAGGTEALRQYLDYLRAGRTFEPSKRQSRGRR